MGQELTIQEIKQIQVSDFRKQLSNKTKGLKAMLPAHVSVERFQSASMIAITNNHDLLGADRDSLLNALIKCAGDGLLPDNREASLVLFDTKVNGEWIKKAQYMPMVYGIIKRMRNSGDISTVEAHVVYEHDEFEFELGDTPRLFHKPNLQGTRGKQLLVYCIVNFKDGSKYREIMSMEEVHKARSKSKGYKKKGGDIYPNSPWVQWPDEMAKKTVIHRAAKRLPASAELDDLMKYDMKVTLNPESIEDENPKAPRENKILENVKEGEIIKDEAKEKPTEEAA